MHLKRLPKKKGSKKEEGKKKKKNKDPIPSSEPLEMLFVLEDSSWVHEVLGLVGDVRSEVSAHDAVPEGGVALVQLLGKSPSPPIPRYPVTRPGFHGSTGSLIPRGFLFGDINQSSRVCVV